MYGECQYNLNSVKEIKVSDSLLSIPENVRECQNVEASEDCKSRKYVEALLETCKCLPFGIQHLHEVKIISLLFRVEFSVYRNPCVRKRIQNALKQWPKSTLTLNVCQNVKGQL